MGSDRTDYAAVGAAAGEEVSAVAWPILLRQRVAGRVERSERYPWVVLATVMAGLFSVNFTFTVFAVALPRVAHELHSSENTLTWVITGPLLAFGVIAPAAGKAGDIFGHKRLYLIGIAGAGIAALLTTLAWDAGSLIAIRTLGSIEGAATGATSMAMIFRVFHPDERVKAMGWWSLVGAGGPVLGVALGGPLIEHIGWRALFLCQVPLTAAAFVLALLVLPATSRDDDRPPFDVAGIAMLSVVVTGVLFAVNRGPEWGWSSPLVLAGFALAPLGIPAFVAIERRAAEPLLPLEYMGRRNFAFPIGVAVGTNFAYMGGFILTPLLLAANYGYHESRIGLMVAARPASFSVMAPIAGYLAIRIGERIAAVLGSGIVVASMLVFAMASGRRSDGLVLAALVLSGVGIGVSSPSVSASVANAVDEEHLGIASAAQQLTTQVGLVAGIQLMKTVQTEAGFAAAYRLGATAAAVAIVAGLFIRSARRRTASPVDALHLSG